MDEVLNGHQRAVVEREDHLVQVLAMKAHQQVLCGVLVNKLHVDAHKREGREEMQSGAYPLYQILVALRGITFPADVGDVVKAVVATLGSWEDMFGGELATLLNFSAAIPAMVLAPVHFPVVVLIERMDLPAPFLICFEGFGADHEACTVIVRLVHLECLVAHVQVGVNSVDVLAEVGILLLVLW